jgi:GNAT superfamily N-acetyltransferase
MHRPTAGRTDGPSIRHARLRDVAAIRDLAHAAARVLCAPDYTPRQVETALRFGLGPDLQMIVDGTYYVVEYDGRLTAAGGWSCRAALMGNLHPDYAGGPRDLLDPAAHPARLRAFFVRPDVARRGLGRALVGLCELAASRAGFTQIELLATPPGRRLCLACGFDDVEPMTNVFPDGVAVPAFRMAKALHPLGPDDEPARRRRRAYGSALSLN